MPLDDASSNKPSWLPYGNPATMSCDEFSAATKRRIASRAGYLCAFPGCPHPRTIGAAMTGDGVIVIGIAAHITAASPKGPRFDSQLTSAQRSHPSNGVWMCNVHGKAVDDDAATFTVEELRKWKAAAEKQSLPNVWTGEVVQGLVAPEEDSPEAALLVALGLPTDTDLDAITARSRAAAKIDLRSFQDSPSRPEQPVLLDLTLEGEAGPKRFSADGLASAAEAHQSIIVRAPPGVGKTTTLLQAAGALCARQLRPPVCAFAGVVLADRRPVSICGGSPSLFQCQRGRATTPSQLRAARPLP